MCAAPVGSDDAVFARAFGSLRCMNLIMREVTMNTTKWVRFKHGSSIGFGALNDGVISVYTGDLFASPVGTGESVRISKVELLAPVEPGKMVAMINNFHELIDKLGATVPQEPHYFFKANSSFHPPEKPIRRPEGYDGKIIFEGELGIVIGKTCKNVSVEDAKSAIFGYTCVNDVTSIEILNREPIFAQWTRCKAADTYGVIGPAIATGLDYEQIRVKANLRGQERQDYPISDMVFNELELVSAISKDMTLYPGDVIACGTSVGVGSMRSGDVIEITIDGIGTLSNTFE